MRKAAFAALLLLLVPLQAAALDTEELLGLVAMPLAVAAVSDVAGVPVADLSHFVATLNRAQVPPTQFVQVVRYAPVALVVDEQPTFIEYVDQQVYQGVTGPGLVTVIENRYRTYDVEPDFVVLEEPATTYVVRNDYIPPLVVTRMAQFAPTYVVGDTNDLLALAAMPLAVAAVADITGVPFNDLSSFVATLNAARMPPLQVVEVLRYAPVALVDPYGRPQFIQFVETQVVSGVTGPRLVDVIGRRLRTYDVAPQFNVIEPREVVIVDDDFFPAVVTTRVAAVRAHPHGGPPGQLKKDLGLQTGAEVVHGTRPGRVSRDVRTAPVGRDRPSRVTVRDRDDDRRVVRQPKQRAPKAKRQDGGKRRDVSMQQERVEQPRVVRQKSERVKPARVDRGKGAAKKSGGAGSGHGHGQSKGKGKGKGKG